VYELNPNSTTFSTRLKEPPIQPLGVYRVRNFSKMYLKNMQNTILNDHALFGSIEKGIAPGSYSQKYDIYENY